MNAPLHQFGQLVAMADIARVIGSHKTSVMRRAEAEAWPYQEKAVRGGKKRFFSLGDLPTDIRKALQNAAIRETLPTIAEKVAAPIIQQAPERLLTDAQRLERDARLGIKAAIDRLLASGSSKEAALITLLTTARAGTLDEVTAQMLRLARDRRGRAGDGYPSIRSLKRWLASEDLTPKIREKDMSVPAWWPDFARHYQIPSRPALSAAYREFVKEVSADACPSIHQVRRFVEKMGAVAKEEGRRGPHELANIKPFIRRSFESLLPNDVWTADGHTFDAEVQHPLHGRPFRPEITAILDVATRRFVGFSVGLAESALVVVEALSYGVRNDGIPAIFYVDNGSGYKNELIKNEFVGLAGRLGISVRHSLPYNSKAKGVIEHSHATIWVPLAKRLPGYMGEPMDREAKLAVFKLSRAAIKKGGVMPITPWKDFVALCEREITDYNNRPHRSLPKIVDASGKSRHMSPNELLEKHKEAGWAPLPLGEQETAEIFRPRVSRTVQRGEIAFGGYRYFSKSLTEFHRDTVQVGYDIHDPQWLWIYDEDGRFIDRAEWNGNARDYFPKSQIEQARERRADGRLKRLDAQRAEIELERAARPLLEESTPITIPGIGSLDALTLEGSARRIMAKQEEILPPEATFVAPQKQATAESPNTEEQVISSAKVAQLRKDRTQFPPETNYREWKALEARVLSGQPIENPDDARWFMTYQKTAQFRAVQKKFEPECSNTPARQAPAM